MQRIDQHSAEGKALQATIKRKLADYLGAGYNDEVLPLYIVVMLAHGTTEPVVVENLEAFLGEHSQAFTTWLFQHMGEASKVEALKIASNAGVAPSSAAATTPAAPNVGAAAAAAAAAAGSTAQQTPGSLATLKAAQAAPSMTNQLSLSASMSAESSGEAGAGEEQASARQPEAAQEQAAAQEATRRDFHEHAGSRHEEHHREHRSERRHSDRARRDDVRHRPERSHRHDGHRQYDRDHRRHGRGDDYERHARYEHARPEEGYRPWGGGGWEPAWRPDYPPLPAMDRYGWAPAHPPPFADPYDRGYVRPAYERQRYRSLSPPPRSRDAWGRGPSGEQRADAHGRWYDGTEDGRRLRRRDAREGSLVPPEVDFEAKAQDVPPEYRRQPLSQLAHSQQRYDADGSAAQLRRGSAPDVVDSQTDTGNGGLQHTSAFDRLSDMPAEMPLSRSLPAGVPQQAQQPMPQQQQPQQSVFARLDGNAAAANGVAGLQQAQQQHQQQPLGSVWDRLSAAPQSAAEANGNVWRRLGPTAGLPQHQQQQQQLQRPGSLDASSDMAAMRAELAKVASMLGQLRAGAQLERAARADRLVVQAQGPADLRSVTVTSVHPLALEHTAILRAHFGICGRIVRATVLRNQATGMPSGKVHIEYTDILAARKALRLSRSLLLDRPVHVRAKALRRF